VWSYLIYVRTDDNEDVIDKAIQSYLDRLHNVPNKPPVKSDKQLTRYIVLPYVNRKADDFANKLKSLVKENYSQVDFNVAFKAPNTISNFFPFKDKITNQIDKSLVVYKIKCATCNVEYIGKTERILGIRLNEHQKLENSACKQHLNDNPGHQLDYNNVEILDTASNNDKIRIKELLHILKRKPAMNKQLNAQSSYEIKTLIIKAYPQHRI
jgi:hypothetical protein